MPGPRLSPDFVWRVQPCGAHLGIPGRWSRAGGRARGAGRSLAWKLLLFCFGSDQEWPGPGPRARWTGAVGLASCLRHGWAVPFLIPEGEKWAATFVSLWPPFLLSQAFSPGSLPWPSWGLWGAHTMSRVGSGLSWYQHCPFFVTADLPGRGCYCAFSGHEMEAPGAGPGPAQAPHTLPEPDRGPERGSPCPQDSARPGIQKAGRGRHRSPLPPLSE